MSREIKFRAWDGSKMHWLDHPWNDHWYNSEKGGQASMNNTNLIAGKLFQSGQLHLMQYTGLKDKNGTKIYEDDILFVDDNYDKFGWASGMRGKVIFDKGKFWLSENSGYKFYFEDNEMNYVEVIGNIHQHPELLNT